MKNQLLVLNLSRKNTVQVVLKLHGKWTVRAVVLNFVDCDTEITEHINNKKEGSGGKIINVLVERGKEPQSNIRNCKVSM